MTLKIETPHIQFSDFKEFFPPVGFLAVLETVKYRNTELGIEKTWGAQAFAEIIFIGTILSFIAALAGLLIKRRILTKVIAITYSSVCSMSIIFPCLFQSLPIIHRSYITERAQKAILKLEEYEPFFIELEKLKPRLNPFDFVIKIENLPVADKTFNRRLKIGVVPFEGNNIQKDKVAWLSAAANERDEYNYGQIQLQSMVTFVLIMIKNESAPLGFSYEVYYTWNWGKNWALLRENMSNVNIEQTKEIQAFIEGIQINSNRPSSNFENR